MSEEEFGFDFEETEKIIYLKSEDGLVIGFNEDYLQNIQFIKTLLCVDKNAGENQQNAIPLKYIDNEMLKLLAEYINYTKEEDYVVKKDRTLQYDDLLNKWDMDFFNKILSNDNMWISIFLQALDYLMFDTFKSKLDTTLAYSLHNNYNNFNMIDIFRTIQLSGNLTESDEEEKKIEN